MQLFQINDEKIYDLLKEYKRLKRDQVSRMITEENPNNINRRIDGLLRKKLLYEENDFIRIAEQSKIKTTFNEHLALELLIYFKDEVTYHCSEEYPFSLMFIKNGKLYDVTVIEPGLEDIQSQLINRSTSERVFAVIDNVSQIDKLSIEKSVQYVIIEKDYNLSFYSA